MHRFYWKTFALGVLAGCLMPLSWGWDGQWTDAKSGQDYIYDPQNSTGKAGSDPPQTFLTPPPRDYLNVDPKELDDYFAQRKKDYSPYALLRLTQTLRYGNTSIPPGYYQVKIGLWGEGSPMRNLPAPPAVLRPPVSKASAPSDAEQAASGAEKAKSSQPLKPIPPLKLPQQRVFIFKQLGNVVAVVPIHQVTIYKPGRKEKAPRHSLAWLEMENRQPILKYYAKPWLFSTAF
jgi:hypothetical protein